MPVYAKKWSPRTGRYYQVRMTPTTGDPRERFEREYAPLREKMVRWAAVIVRRWSDAEDVTQNALLHILYAGDLGRVDHNPEAYAYQTVRNEARRFRGRDWLRSPEGQWVPRWEPLWAEEIAE